MSHCKACDKAINFPNTWKIFDKHYDDVIPDVEENLCQTCLGIAKECYKGYNVLAEIRNEALYRFCIYPPRMLGDSEDVFEVLETEGCIGVEEL